MFARWEDVVALIKNVYSEQDSDSASVGAVYSLELPEGNIITKNSDLNNYKTPGVYWFIGSMSVYNVWSTPPEVGQNYTSIKLIVEALPSVYEAYDNCIIQTLISNSGNDEDDMHTYKRMYSDQHKKWGEWKEVFSDADTSSIEKSVSALETKVSNLDSGIKTYFTETTGSNGAGWLYLKKYASYDEMGKDHFLIINYTIDNYAHSNEQAYSIKEMNCNIRVNHNAQTPADSILGTSIVPGVRKNGYVMFLVHSQNGTNYTADVIGPAYFHDGVLLSPGPLLDDLV